MSTNPITTPAPPAPAPVPPSAPAPVAGPTTEPVAALLARLQARPTGLTAAEAQQRLAATGPNDPSAAQHETVLSQLVHAFVSPLAAILFSAAVVSALLGETLNSVIIVVMVGLSGILNFVQTFRSQQAAARLQAQVAPTATVLRDGAWQQIPRRAVVPGDIIRLAAGDLVPADARLLAEHDLHVQQAALTGESLPVEKAAGDVPPGTAAGADNRYVVLMGTAVVSGDGTAVIYATGRATAFGDIAARLAVRPPETAFERGTRQFSLLITRTVLFLVLFIVLISLATPGHPPLESLLFAVALAVGLTPEFLPMILTVTLSQGAVHMARQNVIVKNLAAIQNFGSIDVLCSDKTGTITSGEMALEQHVDPLGQPAERPFLLAYLNSAFETGVADPVHAAIRAKGAGNPGSVVGDPGAAPAPPAIVAHGNSTPFDEAILRHDHPAIAAYRKLDEVPFDFERRRLSVVVAAPDGGRLLITQGAPEGILPVCTSYEVGGQPRPLDAATRAQCLALFQQFCTQGLRVLAVAARPVDTQPAYRAADEHDLCLAGFLTFSDPPLPDAAQALAVMRADGVRVVIITGDNELVARHVCGQVGLDTTDIVLGDQLDAMTDPALAAVAEQTEIFARVSPAQKNRIILALKSRGHVVGYMGDGINDAPSLHAADVGISVNGAVDVAKDAADIILLRPGLDVLHAGIVEGRRAFGNVMKYLLMGTSSNFGNMFSMAGAFVFLPFLPMLPTQILLNNFLYDLAQVTIPTDNVDASFIRKPQHWDIRLIRDFMLVIGPISSIYDFLTFFVLLNLFHAPETLFHTGWFVESLATQTLVLFVIRTSGNPLRSRPSRPLALTVLAIVAVGLLLPFTPLAVPLGFVPLPASFFGFLALATLTYLALVEIVKRRLMAGRMG